MTEYKIHVIENKRRSIGKEAFIAVFSYFCCKTDTIYTEKRVGDMNRTRRLRKNKTIRGMVRETRLSIHALVYPMFLVEGDNIMEEISAMPGQFRFSIDMAMGKIQEMQEVGVNAFLLFGIPDKKDACGSEGYAENGIIQRAIRAMKERFLDVYLITDVCMCEYTSHGHCGILQDQDVDNDLTLEYLSKIALSHAKAGADMIAPSDMMDGRVAAIRRTLDANGFVNIPIMAYSAKFASAFYGPFRVAADSAPAFGDRKSYQMDIHNRREAIREMEIDIAEGADIIMVKPAMNYLDIVREAKDRFDLPIATYSVSGEYAMVKAAASLGFIDEKRIMMEMAVAAARAGADIYITYFAKEIATVLAGGDYYEFSLQS